MECPSFGVCGSCTLYNLSYDEQLEQKYLKVKHLLSPFWDRDLEVFTSPDSGYRARAEFRIWHDEDGCNYAMSSFDKKSIKILQCPKVISSIAKLMPLLLKEINNNEVLSKKLFGVEFLSSLSGDTLIVMLYHHHLNQEWIDKAKELSKLLDTPIIGRSRKQKVVLSRDYITEKLPIEDNEFIYRHYEGGFTQPNPYVNIKMIEWAKKMAKNLGGDLLEAYCGLGNFTLPLSTEFDKVLATEISKNSIKAAKENLELNSIDNVYFARLSSKEMSEALNRKREFRRLKDIDLDSFNFSTVLVDPPRAGLDSDTKELISNIDNIIYISCNPETLSRDLETLSKTHAVKRAAIFDQFPHTNHIESGVFLQRIAK